MYKDSPENEFGGLNLHALYGQGGKKKNPKQESNLSKPGSGVLPGARAEGNPDLLKKIVL